MRKPPSQAEMSVASNAQPGTPNYMDESADSPGNPFHNKVGGDDVPAYRYNNPRYWEYR